MKNTLDQSLDKKLSKIFTRAVGFCLFVTTIGFSSIFFFYLSKSFYQEHSAISSVVAAISRASLVFKDNDSGKRVLSALQAEKDIIYGALLTSDGSVLAEVGKKPKNVFIYPNEGFDQVNWSLRSVTVSQPIYLDEERVGTIYTIWNLRKFYQQGSLFILIGFCVVTIGILGAYRFRNLLRVSVSDPLISLRNIAQEVSVSKDFSSRLKESNENDEVQRLIRSFNFMMEQIQERDRALIFAKTKAEQADQMKSVFLATVSHELRTPLHAILGMTDEVLETKLTEDQEELLKIVKNSGTLLVSIINDILDFSKIEAGKLILTSSEIELRSLLEKVLKMFTFSAKKKNIELQLEISPDIPEVISVDGSRLAQILVNLIGNAIKFTPFGVIELSVLNRSTADQSETVRLEFCVKDSGIGIPEKALQSIFEAFSQVPGQAGYTEGTGLGLAISSRLVRLMNGKIWAESEINQGSKFLFTIEVQRGLRTSTFDVNEIQMRIPVEKEKNQLVKIDHQVGVGSTILLVEDNPVNVKLAHRVLTKAGYQVVVAENGLECLDRLQQVHVDLALMDIGMPIMDGMEATRRIRALEKELNKPRLPIIALTANFSDDQGKSCIDVGMDEFLTKPLESKKLIQTISKLLHNQK
jgi:signal transduction histidine kinase/ActR/RegA family two-component response regulator